MCYYRFYIFLGCGHHIFSEMPVRYCEDARAKESTESNICLSDEKRDNTHNQINGSTKSDGDAHVDENSSLPDNGPMGGPECSMAGSPRSSHTNAYTEAVEVKKKELTTPVIVKPCGEGRVYPLHTFKLEHNCPVCANERNERLRKLDKVMEEITFDSAKWHWKYHGDQKAKYGSGEKKVDAGWGVGATVGGWMKGWKGKNDN